MDTLFTVKCFLIGFMGLALSTTLIMRSMSAKARAANVIFKPSDYFKLDWLVPVGTLITIGIGLILLPYAPKTWSPVIPLLLFATLGYSGSDVASRLFSVVNKRINSAIDYKTDIADKETGTLGTPTPAGKPTTTNV